MVAWLPPQRVFGSEAKWDRDRSILLYVVFGLSTCGTGSSQKLNIRCLSGTPLSAQNEQTGHFNAVVLSLARELFRVQAWHGDAGAPMCAGDKSRMDSSGTDINRVEQGGEHAQDLGGGSLAELACCERLLGAKIGW